MLPLVLMAIFSGFVVYSIWIMLGRGHDLQAISFFSLFIYTIFAQIGYVYFSELSDFYSAYFGISLFYKYWAFMFLSFVLTYVFYRYLHRKERAPAAYFIKPMRRNYGEYVFFAITIFLLLALYVYFKVYRGAFGYGGGNSAGGPWFGIGFWLFTVVVFVLYTLIRDKSSGFRKRLFSLFLFVLCVLFFLQVNVAAGTRSSILYLFIALVFYELSPLWLAIKKNKKKVFVVLISGLLLVSTLQTLRVVRTLGDDLSFSSFVTADKSESKFAEQTLAATFLLQDYYLPSHTLFLSMQYGIIDPLEVVKSNFANSLVRFEYPFLSNTIMERSLGTSNDRGVGWAYHFFVEGYNAFGMAGVLYNAVIWNIGMLLWLKLSQSNNQRHNRAMLALAALFIALVTRGQFSGFIKFYWLVLLPGLFLLSLANNSTIAFPRRSLKGRAVYE